VFKDICKKENIELNKLEPVLAKTLFYSELLLKKYKKNRLYLPVILSALLNGVVQNKDFYSTNILTIDRGVINCIQNDTEGDQRVVAIQLNKESTWEEVRKVFKIAKICYLGTKKPRKEDKSLMYLFERKLPFGKLPNTISNIKRDRRWYWLNRADKNRLSYEKIAKKKRKGDYKLRS